jgi:hypothetical protein
LHEVSPADPVWGPGSSSTVLLDVLFYAVPEGSSRELVSLSLVDLSSLSLPFLQKRELNSSQPVRLTFQCVIGSVDISGMP